MSGSHWSDDHVAWLRSYIPELGDDPVYIRRADELPAAMHLPGALAWHSVTGDIELKPWLIERNEWQGRGRFVGLNERWHAMGPEEQNGILLHEMAHSICAFDSWAWIHNEDSFTDVERLLMAPGGADELRAQYGLPAADPIEMERTSHGLRFVRCCLHLWARTWEEISLADMRVFSDRYVLTDDSMTDAVRALRPELWHGGHLIDILKSNPPAVFAALFAKKPANSEAKST